MNLESLLAFANSPIGYLIVSAIFGAILKRMKVKQVKVLDILTDAIEEYDKEVADIIPEQYEKKFAGIKKKVDRRLIAGKEKKTVDGILKKKGLLNRKEGVKL